MQILVHLPPGSTAGPIVPDREKLRRWGKTSAAVYRLHLSLYWRWFFPGKHRLEIRKNVYLQSQKPEYYGDPITDDELVSLCFTSGFSHVPSKLLKQRAQPPWGRPLDNFETVLNSVRTMATRPGLRVEAAVLPASYPKGVKIDEEAMQQLQLIPADGLPAWNYTSRPIAPAAA